MKNISVHLQQFIVESLHPKILTGQRFSSHEFEKWKQYINTEAEKLSSQAFKFSLRDRNSRINYLNGLFTQVTELSNITNGYLFKYSRLWKDDPEANQIRQGYVSTCVAFESLLEDLTQRFPEIAERTRFTDYALNRVKVELKSQLVDVRKHLQNQIADPELLMVIIDGLTDLINQRPLLRYHDLYIRKFMGELLKKHFVSSADLTDFLIINDFNLPEFFLFCVATWSDELTKVDGLLEQSEKLLDTKSHLFELSLAKGLKFPSMEQRLYTELNNFLAEKYALVKERLKINRQFATNEGLKPRAKRVLINMSVAQLGLFIRLQVEKGILAKEHIGELFAFFARNFYTPNTDFISPESLQKKSSDVEHATAIKLKAHLIAMLNWLNTNYNLSNYN